MLIDTHAHLNFPEFTADLPALLARAEAAGVGRIITIGTSVEGSREAVALAEQHPHLFAAVGVHPNAATDAADNFIEELRVLARHPKVVAIGEIGLDYHRLPSTQPGAPESAAATDELDARHKAVQAVVFQRQLALALELGLNVVIHERDSWDDTVAGLRAYTGQLRAVFHCFGKSPAQARQIMADGHLISFTGILTFKNAALLQQTAVEIPDDSFMVETDCPYLAPVPNRGKRCEPAWVRLVAEHLARLRGTTLEAIAAQTTATAQRFFRFQGGDEEKYEG